MDQLLSCLENPSALLHNYLSENKPSLLVPSPVEPSFSHHDSLKRISGSHSNSNGGTPIWLYDRQLENARFQKEAALERARKQLAKDNLLMGDGDKQKYRRIISAVELHSSVDAFFTAETGVQCEGGVEEDGMNELNRRRRTRTNSKLRVPRAFNFGRKEQMKKEEDEQERDLELRSLEEEQKRREGI